MTVQTPISLIAQLQLELELEAKTTRKMLERVPEDRFDWQPHPKSMSLIRLATHVAELPGWLPMILNADELDFATFDYQPVQLRDRAELLAYYEQSLEEGRAVLSQVTEEQLEEIWTMRSGDEIHSQDTKMGNVRHTFSQIIHHRAQLGVYLRPLDIPIPGSYGPSADEPGFN